MINELDKLGIPWEMTRRGALRGVLKGKRSSPKRAIVSHLDTLGAMVKNLKPNGRCEIQRIGYWSSRFAEGARCWVYTDKGARRGTILPLKASGHVYNDEIDSQPVTWENVEIRIDEPTDCRRHLEMLGINVGDFVSIDPNPEFSPNGFINSRHLDNKAGTALIMAAAKSIIDAGIKPAATVNLVFTINEEVGSGASMLFDPDVSEMVAIDNGTCAPGQNSAEYGTTIAMMDSTGPFDYHLNRHLIGLCTENAINFQRDVFKYYRCDAAAAVEAGNDMRTALVTFGLDASHGYERTHIDSLRSTAQLLHCYIASKPVMWNDRFAMTSKVSHLTEQPQSDAPPTFTH
jgi:peptidase M42 family hydrolase